MKCFIQDKEHNMFLNVYGKMLHWDVDSKTIFKNKWEAKRTLKELQNKKNYANFELKEVK